MSVFFLILLNIRKYIKLPLHAGFQQNKQTIYIYIYIYIFFKLLIHSNT